MFVLGANRLYRGDILWGGLITPLFAILTIMAFFNGVMDKSPRIIIDDEGITASDLGTGKILWADVQNANLVSIPRGGYVITLELYNATKYSSQINDLFGLKAFTIRIEGLDTPPRIIYNEIVKHINPTTPL